jgi:tRNA synthetase class II (D, K and N)
MAEAVRQKSGVDFMQCRDLAEANAHLAALGVHEQQESTGKAMAKVFEVMVEPELITPTLIFGHPVDISPLAKPMAADPRFAERFEIYIAGMECGDNWSEQNDPAHLLDTWRKAYRAEERDSGHFHTLDFDFIEALEYGMPPTTGIGPGIERMAMIFTEQENIDDVIFFPLMRPVVSAVNAELFGIEERAIAPAQDMTLTFDEFASLCADGVLAPQTPKLVVTPHVRIWEAPAPARRWRASGHVEVEGFFGNGLLRLAGYQTISDEPLSHDDERRKLIDFVDDSLVALVRKTFPECEIRIAVAGEGGEP